MASLSAEEAPICAVEIAEYLLQNVGVGLGKPRALPLQLRKLGRLLSPPQALATDPVGDRSLLKRCVPNRASAAGPATKRALLLRRRIDAIAIAQELRHEHMFAYRSDATAERNWPK
jgi:hypothetical protein